MMRAVLRLQHPSGVDVELDAGDTRSRVSRAGDAGLQYAVCREGVQSPAREDRAMPLDLYPCRLGSLTSLGHAAYTMTTCVQCGVSYAVCTMCPEAFTVCPGCRHRTILAQIAAGEGVFPEALGDHGERHDTTAVAILRADLDVDQAGELAHVTDQAVPLDAGDAAVYNPAMVRSVEVAPALGAVPVDTPASPFVLLLLPVDLAGIPPVLQALAAVIAPHALGGHLNGHDTAAADGQRLPRHLAHRAYLSPTLCPTAAHRYRDTGLTLRYKGSHMCCQCAAQSKPKRPTASTTATTEG